MPEKIPMLVYGYFTTLMSFLPVNGTLLTLRGPTHRLRTLALLVSINVETIALVLKKIVSVIHMHRNSPQTYSVSRTASKLEEFCCKA